jgi:hypothetical protein
VSITSAYSDEHRPLAAYGLLTAAFGALFGGGAAALHQRLPDRPRATDPYCIGQWVAGAMALGQLGAPRTTRFVAGTFAAYALADALQMAHAEAMPS